MRLSGDQTERLMALLKSDARASDLVGDLMRKQFAVSSFDSDRNYLLKIWRTRLKIVAKYEKIEDGRASSLSFYEEIVKSLTEYKGDIVKVIDFDIGEKKWFVLCGGSMECILFVRQMFWRTKDHC
jgi:hypothetical protein